jgi:hypothetical protein
MGRVWGGPNNVDPSPEWRFSGLPKQVASFNFGPERVGTCLPQRPRKVPFNNGSQRMKPNVFPGTVIRETEIHHLDEESISVIETGT